MDALMTQEETLIRLMQEHQADVWRYLRFLGADAATADDVTQEAFIELLRHPIEEISRNHTAAWLRKVARHRFLNHLRGVKRELPMEVLNHADELWLRFTPSGNADDRLEALENCLAKLGERARRAIQLKYADGCKETEVAEVLETSAEGAKALLKRTRGQLRDCVERRVRS